jgi:hypothetical protein
VPGELVPRKLSREQLDRIIQRAAELQAGDMDAGDGITEQELLKLGAEVGIPGRYLRQALYEESAGGAALEHDFLSRTVGPRMVMAQRVVPGQRAALETAIGEYMTDHEAMTPKRRLPDRTVWERQKGLFAEMKRGLSLEGRAYHLARAQDVAVQLTPLEDGYCHAELAADVTNLRESTIVGTASAAGAGLLGGAVLLAVPGLAPLAVLPLLGGILVAAVVARTHRRRAANMQVALEQVLDRLERGEIRSRAQLAGPRPSAFSRIASEIRRSVEDVTQTLRQPPDDRTPRDPPVRPRDPKAP